jgi:uncharacterized protein YdhG (YjbR/CyaY superfamily)
MKKKKSTSRRSTTKRKAVPKNFAEYLSAAPKSARSPLAKMRAAIRSVLPRDATETISYRIPAFKDKTGVLVWFAAFSDHCSLFPTASVIEAFQDELKDFSTSKGTVQFPIGKPLPVALIKNLVKARVQQSKSRRRPIRKS